MNIDRKNSDKRLESAAERIRQARRLIAFTGAGISVESGIPAFRGKGGLWERYDPDLLHIERFIAQPAQSWVLLKTIFYDTSANAEPNAAHHILAAWEARGLLHFLVTQNIDGLHRRAGSRRVAEFHGAMDKLVCTSCRQKLPAGNINWENLPPLCNRCHGLLKPDFVFFGEEIPREVLQTSFAEAEQADVCLIIGSTGAVYPAAQVPVIVKRSGGILIEVDPGETEFTPWVDISIRMGAGEALTQLEALVHDAALR